jgi:hypothetical protein
MAMRDLYSRQRQYLPLLSLGLILSGCVPHQATNPTSDKAAAERLDNLEQRLQKLEVRTPLASPYRNREEIQVQITQLEDSRAKLLLSYTELHPAVRDVDRKLIILRDQFNKMAP